MEENARQFMLDFLWEAKHFEWSDATQLFNFPRHLDGSAKCWLTHTASV